jgi:dihydroorotate dehydrogenase (NAD+) catalytic subunit
MPIELAPDHKIGLALANPIMIASGCGGYGAAYQGLIDQTVFGAIVTNPITLRPRRGAPGLRLVETSAGFVLDTGLQNPGVKKVIREYRQAWSRLGVPIIAHLPAAEPADLHRTARALAGTDTIAAIELGIPHHAIPFDLKPWIEAVQRDCLLPVLVKLPLDRALELAEAAANAAANAGADILVIGLPPLATALSPTGEPVTGYLYGPALHGLALHAVQAVKELVDLPIIAAGGIHTLNDAQAFLQAGASAVQLDSLLFIDPKSAVELARALPAD